MSHGARLEKRLGSQLAARGRGQAQHFMGLARGRTTLGCVMFLHSSDSRSADIWLATLPSCAMIFIATVPPRQRPLYTLPYDLPRSSSGHQRHS